MMSQKIRAKKSLVEASGIAVILFSILVALVLAGSGSVYGAPTFKKKQQQAQFKEGEILVRFKAEAGENLKARDEQGMSKGTLLIN